MGLGIKSLLDWRNAFEASLYFAVTWLGVAVAGPLAAYLHPAQVRVPHAQSNALLKSAFAALWAGLTTLAILLLTIPSAPRVTLAWLPAASALLGGTIALLPRGLSAVSPNKSLQRSGRHKVLAAGGRAESAHERWRARVLRWRRAAAEPQPLDDTELLCIALRAIAFRRWSRTGGLWSPRRHVTPQRQRLSGFHLVQIGETLSVGSLAKLLFQISIRTTLTANSMSSACGSR